MTTLITGCSFVDHVHYNGDTWQINPSKFRFHGMSGSGNTAIAANTLFYLASDQYSNVIVLWSGIRRLDFPISGAHHGFIERTEQQPWHWRLQMSDTVYYHSGGETGSWCHKKDFAKPIYQVFHTQYQDTSMRYFTDLSCMAIASVQNFCKVNNIEYHMAFIYDIKADVTKNDQAHGQIDETSAFYDLVDWSSIETATNVYEWCRDRDLLSDDGYHPSTLGIADYLRTIFGTNVLDTQ